LQRLYRRLLRLYPAEFRSEFATEMELHFADEYREAEGRDARRRFVLRALVDVLVTAPLELARELEQDLRHALRIYGKSPWGTAMAVAMLSLGTAFVFVFLSLYVDLLLRPHPGFEDSARIASIGRQRADGTVRASSSAGGGRQRLLAEIIAASARVVTRPSWCATTAVCGQLTPMRAYR
jgi:hypothetical protein